MTLNEMICPHCGHVSYTECNHVRCASCGASFYASDAAKRTPPNAAMTVSTPPNGFRVMVNNGAEPVTVVPIHSHAGVVLGG